jgi:hypothetical protein
MHGYRVNRDHYLQGWEHVCVQNTPAHRRSIGEAYYHVRMHSGLSLIERDIADHRNHLDLTKDRDLTIHLPLWIKPG